MANRKQILCSHCRGTGANSPKDIKKCPVCDGKGVTIVKKQLGPGFITQMQQTYKLSPFFNSTYRILLIYLWENGD